jgi:hypothetical protein
LRIEKAGGWHHVTARGNERKSIFRDGRDRRHFLEVIEEMAERPALAAVMAAVEQLKGRAWAEFRNEYGDTGRDMALY